MNVLGLVSLIATFALGVWVYVVQRRASADWQTDDLHWKGELDSAVEDITTAVADLNLAVRDVAEEVARLDQERIDADPTGEEESVHPAEPVDDVQAEPMPSDLASYVKELQARGIRLDYDKLNWRKKVRCDGGRGNLGWFVDDGGNKRYFIHRGRGTSVREAIPRALLEVWEESTGREPCEIELDYQTGAGRGNHAWYVRTYEGQTWRMSAGGKSKTTPTVTLLETS